MPGELWRQKMQVGKEITYGTAVAATRIVYVDNPSLTREREGRPHAFATGTRERVRAHTLGPVMAAGQVTVPMSADELLEWLLISIQGNVTPSTPAGGTATRLWEFEPSTTLDSATIELDDGANVWEEYGVYGAKITISGSVSGENTVTIDLFGKDRVASTLTGALSERTPTFMEGWETRLYADAFGGTALTTQLGGVLINWTIEIELNPGRKYTADNTLAMNSVTIGEVLVTANLTFEASSALVDTEYANWDAETNRLVALEFGQNEQIESSPTNEVQTLTEGTAMTAGTFTLSFRGATTTALAFNATAATIQAALEALPSIGVGNVTVTGGGIDTSPATVTFVNQLGGLNVPQLTSNQASLTGTFTHATTTPGVGYKRAVQVILPGAWTAVDTTGEDAGTRVYEFGLQTIYDTTNTYSLKVACYTSRTAAWT